MEAGYVRKTFKQIAYLGLDIDDYTKTKISFSLRLRHITITSCILVGFV